MALPELLQFETEEEYKQHYVKNYCEAGPIFTFDRIPVKFFEDRFEHAFYQRTHKSWKAEKDRLDIERAERMDWIKHVLQDPSIIPRKGYDKSNGSYDNSRRVAFLTEENYLVVIYINKRGVGKFITAFLVDNEETAEKIRSGPLWER